MWKVHPETERFLDLLAAVDYAGSYYGLAERVPVGDASWSDSPSACASVLDDLGLPAKHFRGEDFFRHEVTVDAALARLHLTFRGGRLELGVYVTAPDGDLGGTAHGLARAVARRRTRRSSSKSPFPRVPYGGRADALVAVKESAALFRCVTDAYSTLVGEHADGAG